MVLLRGLAQRSTKELELLISLGDRDPPLLLVQLSRLSSASPISFAWTIQTFTEESRTCVLVLPSVACTGNKNKEAATGFSGLYRPCIEAEILYAGS